jgi:hypothetical protein
MTKASPFEIVFDELVPEHLDVIEGKSISLIRTTIEEQLRFEPHVETRNRKPLSEPTTFGATWELRFGPNNRFRVFYDIHLTDKQVVVLAIGVKIRNELWIGKERWEI